MIFLCETKTKESRLRNIARSLGFSEQLIVEAQGKSGGVCLFWTSNIAVEVLEFNSVTVAINIRDSVCSWSLIGFYGHLYYSKRRKAWTNLCALLESLDGPWLCFGDFNVVLGAEEKEGGKCGSSSATNFLKNLMFDLGAVDLGFSGTKYTWRNNRWGREVSKKGWIVASPVCIGGLPFQELLFIILGL